MAPLLLVVLLFPVVMSQRFVALPLSRMASLLLVVLLFSVVMSQVLVPVLAA